MGSLSIKNTQAFFVTHRRLKLLPPQVVQEHLWKIRGAQTRKSSNIWPSLSELWQCNSFTTLLEDNQTERTNYYICTYTRPQLRPVNSKSGSTQPDPHQGLIQISFIRKWNFRPRPGPLGLDKTILTSWEWAFSPRSGPAEELWTTSGWLLDGSEILDVTLDLKNLISNPGQNKSKLTYRIFPADI